MPPIRLRRVRRIAALVALAVFGVSFIVLMASARWGGPVDRWIRANEGTVELAAIATCLVLMLLVMVWGVLWVVWGLPGREEGGR